jgi:hypothetical protein
MMGMVREDNMGLCFVGVRGNRNEGSGREKVNATEP